MILTRMGAVAASKASGSVPPITYYSIALSGSYQSNPRPNDVDLYWDSGSGYQYVTTLTPPDKGECYGITTLTVASGSAIGFIKFVDPGNCDVRFDIILNDSVCNNVDSFDNCEYDIGTATGNTTHAVRIQVTPGNDQQLPPIPPSFNCC